MTVRATGADRLELGRGYRLERRKGEGWRWLNRRDPFLLISVAAGPKRPYRQAIELPVDLEPGRYRVSKGVTVCGSTAPGSARCISTQKLNRRDLTVSDEFEVKAPP